MRGIFFAATLAGTTLAMCTLASASAQQAPVPPNQISPNPGTGTSQGGGQGQGRGQRDRGFGGFPGGARGILGSVTEVAADHYTIKTDTGDLYTVHYSANTRILKQPPGGARFSPDGSGRAGSRSNGGRGNGALSGSSEDANSGDVQRQMPQPLKPTDIRVGDIVSAAGEIDAAAKSLGAVLVVQIDPERAKQMREMQANYGKTWLAGRITAIDGTRITIEGIVDHAPHVIDVDENTSFRQRRDAITLADIKPGEQLRAEGAAKDGVFRATVINTAIPQNRDASSGTSATFPQQ